MTLDIEKLRAKLNALKDPKSAKAGKNDNRIWKPQENSTSNIRLLQYPHSEDPFVERHFHYNIGRGAGIPCPYRNEGQTCPICEFATELYNNGKGDVATAKKLFARQRIFAAMIDRSDAAPVPRLWGFGKEIYQVLLTNLLSEHWGTFLDPVNGYDTEVSSVKAQGAEFPKTTLNFIPKQSKVAATSKDIQNILNAVPRVEDVFKSMTMNEINSRLSAWMQLTEKDGSETVKGKKVAEASEETEDKNENFAELDTAFEKALNE